MTKEEFEKFGPWITQVEYYDPACKPPQTFDVYNVDLKKGLFEITKPKNNMKTSWMPYQHLKIITKI